MTIVINQETIDKLKELKLLALLGAWQQQQAQPDYAGLGFDERLGLLVDAEWLSRLNARLRRNLKEARLHLPPDRAKGPVPPQGGPLPDLNTQSASLRSDLRAELGSSAHVTRARAPHARRSAPTPPEE